MKLTQYDLRLGNDCTQNGCQAVMVESVDGAYVTVSEARDLVRRILELEEENKRLEGRLEFLESILTGEDVFENNRDSTHKNSTHKTSEMIFYR